MTPSPHGSTGASHPAIKRALQVYGKDWGSLSETEDAFLKALRAADVKMIAEVEAAGRLVGFGSRLWERERDIAALQRDADYADALKAFEAAEMEWCRHQQRGTTSIPAGADWTGPGARLANAFLKSLVEL